MSKTRVRTKTTSVESSIKRGGTVTQITEPTTKKETSIAPEGSGQVTVEGGITKNLGDFNSARIGVSVSLPCEPTIEGAKKAYAQISKLVDQLMNEEYDKVMSTEN